MMSIQSSIQLAADTLAAPSAAPPDMDFWGLFIKMCLALAVVVSLAVVLLKFGLPRLPGTFQKRSSSLISVIDVRKIGPKNYLFLVEVESVRLLLGSSESGISILSRFTTNDDNVTNSSETTGYEKL